jgi:hypothetical protein
LCIKKYVIEIELVKHGTRTRGIRLEPKRVVSRES